LFKYDHQGPAVFNDCINRSGNCAPLIDPRFGVVYHGVEQALGFDPCYIYLRSDLTSKRVSLLNKFLSLTSTYFDPQGRKVVFNLFACETNKIQFFREPALVLNSAELLKGLKDQPENNFLFFVEERDWRQANLPLTDQKSNISPYQAPLDVQSKVTQFSPNHVLIQGEVPKDLGAVWINYVDAWDPAWKATLNGAPVPILPSNLAFKAIRILPGKFQLELTYHTPVHFMLAKLMYGIGFLFIAALTFVFVRLLQGKD